MPKKLIYLIIIAIIAVLILVGVVFYFSKKAKPNQGQTEQEAINSALQFVVPQINAENIISNPLEGAPSINPLDKVANPFEDGYKNPFAEN